MDKITEKQKYTFYFPRSLVVTLASLFDCDVTILRMWRHTCGNVYCFRWLVDSSLLLSHQVSL